MECWYSASDLFSHMEKENAKTKTKCGQKKKNVIDSLAQLYVTQAHFVT